MKYDDLVKAYERALGQYNAERDVFTLLCSEQHEISEKVITLNQHMPVLIEYGCDALYPVVINKREPITLAYHFTHATKRYKEEIGRTEKLFESIEDEDKYEWLKNLISLVGAIAGTYYGAMGILRLGAMYGTAATGTKIITLSGAAKLTTTLAWLGRAVGGAGMKAGIGVVAVGGLVIGGCMYLGVNYMLKRNKLPELECEYNALNAAIRELTARNNLLRLHNKETLKVYHRADKTLSLGNISSLPRESIRELGSDIDYLTNFITKE